MIDNLFVQMGVRFISLAENVDSYKNPDSVSNIIVPITNVMNDNYCYQTSKKIRQVFDYKRRNGQYIDQVPNILIRQNARHISKAIKLFCFFIVMRFLSLNWLR